MTDANGYPTDSELQAILEFNGTPHLFVEYIQSIWWHDCYSLDVLADDSKSEQQCWQISTVGWSGNEEIICNVQQTFFYYFYWYQSTRGGHYEYRIPVDQWDTPTFLGAPANLPAGGA